MPTNSSSSRRGFLSVLAATTAGSVMALEANTRAVANENDPNYKIYDVIQELGPINDASLVTVNGKSKRPHWIHSPANGPKVTGTNKSKEIQDLINRVSDNGGGTIYYPLVVISLLVLFYLVML